MAVTRHSSQQSVENDSAPHAEVKSSPHAGSKRKAETTESPQGKRGRKAQKQQTLEETLDNGNDTSKPDAADEPADVEMKHAATEGEGTDRPAGAVKEVTASKPAETKGEKADAGDDQAEAAAELDDEEAKEMLQKADEAEDEDKENASRNGSHPTDADEKADGKPETTTQKGNASEGKGAVIEHASDREGIMPSNILEKGIIYFFTRGRVGVEEPDSVQDLQRTYFVLRPIPKDGKIGEGALQDEKTGRLIAIPKKVLPKSGRDRFMVFVEKSGTSMKELKDEFFQGSEYDTKTVGTRQTPPVAPIGEGVYALTTTGRTSHLAYMLTIPKELNEVQTDLGLREKGSFVTSLKNPTVSGPAYATLPEKPDYPEEFIKDFGGRSWMPIEKPEYLNYPNAQLLLIGEGEDKFASALEPTEKDKKHDKETPQEELEKLEHEDEVRAEHMQGDDTVFADLGISKSEYPDVMTTW